MSLRAPVAPRKKSISLRKWRVSGLSEPDDSGAAMKYLCPYCEEYARSGHNFCRMCGTAVATEDERRSEVQLLYDSPEKYCGHCGRLLRVCSGKHGS